MNEQKIIKGQYFTKNNIWLRNHIKDFIINTKCDIVYDPFAGEGDLLKIAPLCNIKKVKGLDIDKKFGWDYNDSLINIPHIDNAIVITNPPYLYKVSASHQKLLNKVNNYYRNYDNLYLEALDNILKVQDYVVAIIPESFLKVDFKYNHRLHSITILENNPFDDTQFPVCVVCFDNVEKDYKEIKIYKNDIYIYNLEYLYRFNVKPTNIINIKINDKKGWLGLRAIDLVTDNKILFDFKENFDYDWENKINKNSRCYVLINVDIPINYRKQFINYCNDKLNYLRVNTQDLILTAFKGNNKDGDRRRILSIYQTKWIMEQAYNKIFINSIFESG